MVQDAVAQEVAPAEEQGSKRNIILGYDKVARMEEAIQNIRLMVAGFASQLDAINSRQHSQSRELDKLETRVGAIELARGIELGSSITKAKTISTAWIVVTGIIGIIIGAAGVVAMFKGLPH